MMIAPLFIGGLGPIEMGLILAILVLLFGASKIPELARSTGLALGEFEKGREEVERELAEMRDADDETDTNTSDEEAEQEVA